MKRFIYIIVTSLILVSCTNELGVEFETEIPISLNDDLNLTDGVIIGEKLRNPYSLEVMKQACDMLYPPTRGEAPVSDSLIVPNVKYVRFLPTDSIEYRTLSASKLELFNYPLDYDILGDPSDYHDPNLPPEQITWQYTVMPIDDPLPIVKSEVLELAYIPTSNNVDGLYDMEAIENTAIKLGLGNNLTLLDKDRRPSVLPIIGESVPYIGKIQLCDSGNTNAKGVKGVKIRARHFFKIRTDFTDEQGRYFIDMDEFPNCTPRLELRFENEYGFKLGYNVELIMPQTFNMKDTHSFTFKDSDSGKNYKAWVLGTINNAAYDWYKRCETEGMPTPPSNLYIWAMEIAGGAACPMLHHGTFNTSGLSLATLATFLFGPDFGFVTNVWLSILFNTIAPDVFVFGVDNASTNALYRLTCHELAHATHFQQVGEDVLDRALWWADVINYEVACGVLNGGGSPYEHSSLEKEGKVGVTEMWAHAVGYICGCEHLGSQVSSYPNTNKYWFAPEIIVELYKKGMSLSQISKSMTGEIVMLNDFQKQLTINNAAYEVDINKLFNKYLYD